MQRPIESVMYNDNVDTSTLSDGKDTIGQSELTGLTECGMYSSTTEVKGSIDRLVNTDRINCYHPGWRSPPEVYAPAKSTVRNSVEEVSLHSDVVEHFYIVTCNHLSRKYIMRYLHRDHWHLSTSSCTSCMNCEYCFGRKEPSAQ